MDTREQIIEAALRAAQSHIRNGYKGSRGWFEHIPGYEQELEAMLKQIEKIGG